MFLKIKKIVIFVPATEDFARGSHVLDCGGLVSSLKGHWVDINVDSENPGVEAEGWERYWEIWAAPHPAFEPYDSEWVARTGITAPASATHTRHASQVLPTHAGFPLS